MRVTRVRKLAARGGIFGLLAAGVYIVLRMAFCEPRNRRRMALGLAACVAIGWWVVPYLYHTDPFLSGPIAGLSRAESAEYDIVDLGAPGEGAIATGINDGGDVAGVVILDEKTFHAALWHDGKMRDLGTLGGSRSMAASIGRNGTVVGRSETSSGTIAGFRWNGKKMEALQSLDKRLCSASAVNGRGDIAGVSTDRQNPVVACVWQGDRPRSLGVPDGYQFSFGEAINESGNIAGLAITKKQDRIRAFAWIDGRERDLGTLDGGYSYAMAIGDRGQVGGASTVGKSDEESLHACLWENGKPRDLGLLSGMEWSAVSSINGKGDVVGSSGVG